MRRVGWAGLAVVVLLGIAGTTDRAAAAGTRAERRVEPVVLTGAQLPRWSRLPAEGAAAPHNPSSGVRDAHNGTLTVPPDARAGAPIDQIAAYSWRDGSWVEVPVQIDERFPYFLANYRSDFGVYSGTDKELTYEWDIESWKKTAGRCEAEYPATDETRLKGFPAQDPVTTFDDDDELVFMASDAGQRVPEGFAGPPGTTTERYAVRVDDPLDPRAVRYVYLFLQEGGSSFDASNGYVSYQRDADADEWIDRASFAPNDPEKLGTSNTGYGPNLEGTVCDPDGTVRESSDRFPRDGVTVSTDSYKWYASGRWMIRSMQVARPGQPGVYGPDLIDRWKGRAFQQSPASEISLVGFEDEQVNWEANSSLLGERMGPVRAIREVWGADSGTNVTKTEYFYRDSIAYRYRVRVHPIPPDGLYTSWDYNHDRVSTYYNELMTEDDVARPGGVPIDGVNDDIGNIDSVPLGEEEFAAFFDAPDPTFTKPLAMYNWEQVSGRDDNGSLVYMFELKNAEALENPTVVPYYRDDACLDDGTGDDPSPHPHPGDPYTEEERRAIPCYTEAPEGYTGPYRQGAFGSHGIHYLFTNDTDNTFSPERTTEIDGQQWQWAVPTEAPHAVGDAYANTVKAPLVAIAQHEPNKPGRYQTSIEIGGDRSGQVSDEVTLSARLTARGRPLAGKDVIFQLDGRNVGRVATDGEGHAAMQITLAGPARTADTRVIFPGDEEYGSSEQPGRLDVLHEDTTTTLEVSRRRRMVTLRAVLRDADSSAGLAGKTLTFSIDGRERAAATTDDSGVAAVRLRAKTLRRAQTAGAVFAGDAAYLGSYAESPLRR
ncbi:MAG: Ig-like domain-containing protein [Actinomycetota bacterium]|nr:Ig-like domain-containing protein [Actinomycetota bacterium]